MPCIGDSFIALDHSWKRHIRSRHFIEEYQIAIFEPAPLARLKYPSAQKE